MHVEIPYHHIESVICILTGPPQMIEQLCCQKCLELTGPTKFQDGATELWAILGHPVSQLVRWSDAPRLLKSKRHPTISLQRFLAANHEGYESAN
jgi:hypothetical protein